MNDADYDHCRRCGNSYQEQLSNLRNQVEELDAENERLKEQLLLSESQNYCKICGNTLDGYLPPELKG